MLYIRLALILTFVASTSAQEYRWPSPQHDSLEALLYEGRRGDGSSLAAIIHPCKTRPDTNASIGAEWLRFVCFLAFSRLQRDLDLPRPSMTQLHMTYPRGVGGLMAQSLTSLAYQRCVCLSLFDNTRIHDTRSRQNFGAGFTHTLSDFEVYPNKYVSRQ